MANVTHASLTGANLHEPKGVSGATAGTVYVADGGGSGSWTTLGASSISSVVNPWGAAMSYYRDEKSASVDGGSFTSGSWVTRTLNTEVYDENSLTLSSNRISLGSGDWIVQARAPAYGVEDHQVRLYNYSDSTVIAVGTSMHTAAISASTFVENDSWVFAKFTLASTKSIELQHRCATTRASNGLGNGNTWGTNVYAELWIWKTA